MEQSLSYGSSRVSFVSVHPVISQDILLERGAAGKHEHSVSIWFLGGCSEVWGWQLMAFFPKFADDITQWYPLITGKTETALSKEVTHWLGPRRWWSGCCCSRSWTGSTGPWTQPALSNGPSAECTLTRTSATVTVKPCRGSSESWAGIYVLTRQLTLSSRPRHKALWSSTMRQEVLQH